MDNQREIYKTGEVIENMPVKEKLNSLGETINKSILLIKSDSSVYKLNVPDSPYYPNENFLESVIKGSKVKFKWRDFKANTKGDTIFILHSLTANQQVMLEQTFIPLINIKNFNLLRCFKN